MALSSSSSLGPPRLLTYTSQPPRLPAFAPLPRAPVTRATAAGDGEASSTSSPTASSTSSPTASPVVPAKKTVIRRVRKAEDDASMDVNGSDLRSPENSKVSVEGVVRLQQTPALSLKQLALLAGGDALSLLLFAYIGRATHVSTAVDFELLKTALPFLSGWLLSALLFAEYSPSRSLPQGLGSVATSTAKTWAVGVPVGIVIRSLTKGQAPQVLFVLVSMLSTAVILTAWRYAFFSIVAKGTGVEAQASDRKGNVFEFFDLLTSLVKRW